MSDQTHSNDKFLVTVDAESREVVRVEQMGEAGELVEVATSLLTQATQGASGEQATAGVPPSYAINIFMGSGESPNITTSRGRAVEASSVEEPPMVIPSPGVIPSAGSLSTSSEDQAHSSSVQG